MKETEFLANKFYAIRKGEKTGIFTTWDECRKYITGYSGAEYKSFTTIKAAEDYFNKRAEEVIEKNQDYINTEISEAVAYVDGSYNSETNEFSFGAVIFWENKEYQFSDKFSDKKLAEMHNVAGELKGSERAIEFALENKISKLTIHHDYEGIAKWCTGEWQARKVGTIAYKNFYETAKQKVHITFVKVKGHSGDKYNDLADQLAKKSIF